VRTIHRAGLSWAHLVGSFGRPVVLSQSQVAAAVTATWRSAGSCAQPGQKAAGTGQQRRHPAELRSSLVSSN
jgi:hypothetical protein